MTFQAGKMREQISIQATTFVRSTDTGESIQTVSTISSGLWCSVQPQAGNEFFTEDQRHGRLLDTFVIRYTTAIDASLNQKGLVAWKGKTWDIKQIIDPDNSNKHLMIGAEAITQ
jgi:SPP1 family predicted phage head-tail adaptor